MSRLRARWLLVAVLIVLFGLVAWYGYRSRVGEPSARLDDEWNRSTEVVDRHGRPLRELPSSLGQRGRPLALEQMGDRLVLATLVSEDKRFYEHAGVDTAAVVRAAAQNVVHLRVVSGASTVTQQLVKLLDHGGRPPEDRGLDDKVREAARAQNLEETMSKREILEAYLNRLSYGNGLVGPASAAEAMFGVSPAELSWAQATLMAVLPRAPSYLNPYEHESRATKRQRELLEALHEQGFIDDEGLRRALIEPLALRSITHSFEAPYFVEALRHGKLGDPPRRGASTQTTLDGELQRDVEALADNHAVRLERKKARGMAVLVVDNASGEVLSYLGGIDWSREEPGAKIDMVQSPRQPGSALKPFVYTMAFEGGMEPTEMLADVPTRFGERAGGYRPKNFDGSFFGPISAREALAGSLNVPAVRLAQRVGEAALLERLQQLGFASLTQNAEHYGLALALGSGEVTLAELTRAYVTLARGGVGVELRYTVADPSQLGVARAEGTRRIEAAAAAAVSDALSDPQARVRGLGGRGPFDVGFPVAVKTGTSSGYRDGWAVGYTRERTVAVWVGNPDGAPTDELTGGGGAGPLFADVMLRAMRDVGEHAPLYDAELLHPVAVCALSGKPAGEDCPHAIMRRWMHPPAGGHAEPCDLHVRVKPAQDGAVACDRSGAQVAVALPREFDGWLAQQPRGAPGRDADTLAWYPRSALAGCGEGASSLQVVIDEPRDGSVLLASRSTRRDRQRLELVARVTAAATPTALAFVLDGETVATASSAEAQAAVAQVPLTPGEHVLEVRPVDAALPARLARSRFSVR